MLHPVGKVDGVLVLSSGHGGQVPDVDHEASLLELHDAGVVDAGSLREDENRKLVRVLNVLLQSAGHSGPVLDL